MKRVKVKKMKLFGTANTLHGKHIYFHATSHSQEAKV